MMQASNKLTTETSGVQTWSVKSLIGYNVLAQDGETGKLYDLFFNQKFWTVEYLVVDIGNWMLDTGAWTPGQKTLVLAHNFGHIFREGQTIRVDLTKTQVEYSPQVDPQLTSLTLDSHTLQPVPPTSPPLERMGGGLFEPEHIGLHPDSILETIKSREAHQQLATPAIVEAEAGHHVHSLTSLLDLYIEAKGGSIGHIEDFLVNTETWKIEHMVVDTRNWFPGKKVIVPPQTLKRVDLAESTVFVDLSPEEIQNSPTINFTNGETPEVEVP